MTLVHPRTLASMTLEWSEQPNSFRDAVTEMIGADLEALALSYEEEKVRGTVWISSVDLRDLGVRWVRCNKWEGEIEWK